MSNDVVDIKPRKMQAVIMGIDRAIPGSDTTTIRYRCRECGFVIHPCEHLKGYLSKKSQSSEEVNDGFDKVS